MTYLERMSATRVKALKKRVEKNDLSVEGAIEKLDELNTKGLLTAKDFEETFTYFEELLNAEEDDTVEEPSEEIIDNEETINE